MHRWIAILLLALLLPIKLLLLMDIFAYWRTVVGFIATGLIGYMSFIALDPWAFARPVTVALCVAGGILSFWWEWRAGTEVD